MPYYNHNDHYADLLLRHAPTPCSASLDIGCGEGRLLARLAQISDVVVGIDTDRKALDGARTLGLASAELVHGDFLDHPFSARAFDFVTAVASLHHIPFDEALARMASVLQPGGVIAASASTAAPLWSTGPSTLLRCLSTRHSRGRVRRP